MIGSTVFKLKPENKLSDLESELRRWEVILDHDPDFIEIIHQVKGHVNLKEEELIGKTAAHIEKNDLAGDSDFIIAKAERIQKISKKLAKILITIKKMNIR